MDPRRDQSAAHRASLMGRSSAVQVHQATTKVAAYAAAVAVTPSGSCPLGQPAIF